MNNVKRSRNLSTSPILYIGNYVKHWTHIRCMTDTISLFRFNILMSRAPYFPKWDILGTGREYNSVFSNFWLLYDSNKFQDWCTLWQAKITDHQLIFRDQLKTWKLTSWGEGWGFRIRGKDKGAGATEGHVLLIEGSGVWTVKTFCGLRS